MAKKKKRIHEFHPNPWIQKRIRFFRAREREPIVFSILLSLPSLFCLLFLFLYTSIYFRLYLYHRFIIIFNWIDWFYYMTRYAKWVGGARTSLSSLNDKNKRKERNHKLKKEIIIIIIKIFPVNALNFRKKMLLIDLTIKTDACEQHTFIRSHTYIYTHTHIYIGIRCRNVEYCNTHASDRRTIRSSSEIFRNRFESKQFCSKQLGRSSVQGWLPPLFRFVPTASIHPPLLRFLLPPPLAATSSSRNRHVSSLTILSRRFWRSGGYVL